VRGLEPRRGLTLVELMVVLVLLALVAEVAGVAMRAPRDAGRRVSDAEAAIARARREALASGRPVTVRVAGAAATALPDGSVLTEVTPRAASSVDSRVTPVDRLSGRVRRASR